MTITDLTPLHPAATGFSLFRVLRNGRERGYTAVEFERGWPAADRFRRELRLCGYICDISMAPSSYGILDVLDADGDIVQDYAVPTAAAFRYIKRKLKLSVVEVSQ